MGYSTDFSGSLELTPAATPEQIAYINTFSSTRRMKRDVAKLQEIYKGEHGLPGIGYGTEGEYFCKDDGNFGQNKDVTIINFNSPSSTQPSLWCQWILTKDGKYLEWDGSEKFYEYVKWLEYMNENFFKRWGIILNGEIKWRGENFDDIGKIIVENGIITTMEF